MDGININFDVNTLVNKVGEAVNGISTKVGTTGEELFKYAVVGKMAEGYAKLAISVLFLIVIVLVIFAIRYSETLSCKDAEAQALVIIISTIILVVSTIGLGTNLYTAVLNITAPEYMLIKDIFHAVKNNL